VRLKSKEIMIKFKMNINVNQKVVDLQIIYLKVKGVKIKHIFQEDKEQININQGVTKKQ